MDTGGLTGVVAANSRDEDWFTSLYHDNYQTLLAYARRRVDEQTADEVVADTFLVAWRRRDDIPAGFERPWLYGVARNTIRTAARAAARRGALNGRLHGDVPPESRADDRYEVSDRADALVPALQSLREEDREVLMLMAWEGLSHAEIGQVLGVSPNAVAIRVHRARKRLSDRLDEAGVNCEV